MNSGIKKIIQNAICVIFSVMISIIIIEYTAEEYIFDPGHTYIKTPQWKMRVTVGPDLPGVTGDHVVGVNRLGFRGPLSSAGDHPRIAVLGGSTVEDWALRFEKSWVYQLQGEIKKCSPRAWTANLGKAGVNARHHLLQLPAIEPYMPRFDYFVILMGLNDFLLDLRIHHSFELPKNWWRDQALMYKAGDEGRFASVAVISRFLRTFTGNPSTLPDSSDFGAYMHGLWQAYQNLDDSRWVRTLPDISIHLSTYRKTILSLDAYAKKYGAKAVFVTQPAVWFGEITAAKRRQMYAGFIGHDMKAADVRWYTPEAQRKGLHAYNETLLDTCKRHDLTCINAASLLGDDRKNFYDDFHFSEEGASNLASIVASGLRAKTAICQK